MKTRSCNVLLFRGFLHITNIREALQLPTDGECRQPIRKLIVGKLMQGIRIIFPNQLPCKDADWYFGCARNSSQLPVQFLAWRCQSTSVIPLPFDAIKCHPLILALGLNACQADHEAEVDICITRQQRKAVKISRYFVL